MPRHIVRYDKDLKETPEWKSLYGRYNSFNNRKYRQLFGSFQAFYDWSMANGFAMGARFDRLDPSKPYTLDNCCWVLNDASMLRMTADERTEAIKKWNETVNRIRVHFGMKPF